MTSDRSDVVVRVAGQADIAALASLRSLQTGNVQPEPEFERRMAAWLAGEGGRRTTWVAGAGDLPVGMVSLFEYRRMPRPGCPDSRWGYIGNMFVHDHFRNCGVGSALLAALTAAADERDYARLVVAPSAEALSLFRRGGFTVPGDATGADALWVRPGPHT